MKRSYIHPRNAPAMLVLALLLASCGAETSGSPLSFETAVRGMAASASATTTFVNSKGWSITLSQAKAAIGPVYYYSSSPQAGRWRRLFGISSALACPAHAQFDKGTVLGEVLRQYVIDLLADSPVSTGVSHGEQGLCQMFELHFHPPGAITAGTDTEAFAALEGSSFRIAGVARKDAVSISFSGHLTIPDEGTMRIVENIAADMELIERPGRAVTIVYLDQWLTNVDFASILDESGACRLEETSGVCRIGEDTQAWLAWLSGVRSRQSYVAQWHD